jgi:hypothetical protein
MKLHGEVVDFPKFQKRIEDAYKAVGDLSAPFTAITNDWYKDNQQIFQLGGSGMYPDFVGKRDDQDIRLHTNPRAKHLQPGLTAYMRRKEAAVGFIYPLLKFSGRLATSILDPTGDGAYHIIGKKNMAVGTEVKYAIYHQSSLPRKKMPYRPMIFNHAVYGGYANVFQSRMKRYIRTIETYIKRRLKRRSIQ